MEVDLPVEVQSIILSHLPLSDYPTISAILQLHFAFSSKNVWDYINLDQPDAIDDEFFNILLQYMHHVEALVWQTSHWTSGLPHRLALQHLTNLTLLDLSGNSHIADLAFLQQCASLKYLNLHECDYIPANDFTEYLSHLTNLRSLDISDCCIDEDVIRGIVEQVPSLQKPNVLECCFLTIETVESIAGSLEELKFCLILHFDFLTEWIDVVRDYPQCEICPASFEIITDIHPDYI